jgi:hypothetical protein
MSPPESNLLKELLEALKHRYSHFYLQGFVRDLMKKYDLIEKEELAFLLDIDQKLIEILENGAYRYKWYRDQIIGLIKEIKDLRLREKYQK